MADSVTLAGALESAGKLEAEYRALIERIDANRKLCRLLRDNGVGTEAERARVDVLYKPRERKAKAKS